jgi:hypothetical protein
VNDPQVIRAAYTKTFGVSARVSGSPSTKRVRQRLKRCVQILAFCKSSHTLAEGRKLDQSGVSGEVKEPSAISGVKLVVLLADFDDSHQGLARFG